MKGRTKRIGDFRFEVLFAGLKGLFPDDIFLQESQEIARR
jgi:hypothetical protein